MKDQSNTELIAKATKGSTRAFGQLVARHQDRVFRFLVGMVRDRTAAEDLTQDTFVKAGLHLGRLEKPDSFGAWTLSIARHLALDWLRSPAHAKTSPRADHSKAPSKTEPEMRIHVRNTLARMSEQDREILLLVDLLGLSIQELTTHFSLTPSAAKMRIFRARERFRRLFLQPVDETRQEEDSE